MRIKKITLEFPDPPNDAHGMLVLEVWDTLREGIAEGLLRSGEGMRRDINGNRVPYRLRVEHHEQDGENGACEEDPDDSDD